MKTYANHFRKSRTFYKENEHSRVGNYGCDIFLGQTARQTVALRKGAIAF